LAPFHKEPSYSFDRRHGVTQYRQDQAMAIFLNNWRAEMSEFKPKKDDSRAGDGDRSGRKDADSPKPHGDKLKHAVDEAAEPTQNKR
jgi:hypothetical protein